MDSSRFRQRNKGSMFGLVMVIIVAAVLLLFAALYGILGRFNLLESKYQVSLNVQTEDRGTELITLLSTTSDGVQFMERVARVTVTHNTDELTEKLTSIFNDYKLTINGNEETIEIGTKEEGTRLAMDIPLPGAQEGKAQGKMVLIT